MNHLRQSNGSIIYKCVHCEQIGRKWQLVSHALKDHVAEERVPFFCSLCKFRCQNLDTLLQHTTKYKRHTEAMEKQGPLSPANYLMKSRHPVYVDDDWMTPLSRAIERDETPLSSEQAMVPVQPSAMLPVLREEDISHLTATTKAKPAAPAYTPTPIRPKQVVPSPIQPAMRVPVYAPIAASKSPQNSDSAEIQMVASGTTKRWEEQLAEVIMGTPLQDERLDDIFPGPFDLSDPLFLGRESPLKRTGDGILEPTAKRQAVRPPSVPTLGSPAVLQSAVTTPIHAGGAVVASLGATTETRKTATEDLETADQAPRVSSCRGHQNKEPVGQAGHVPDVVARIIEEAMQTSTNRLIEAMDRNAKAVINAVADLRSEVYRIERRVSALADRPSRRSTSPKVKSVVAKPRRR